MPSRRLSHRNRERPSILNFNQLPRWPLRPRGYGGYGGSPSTNPGPQPSGDLPRRTPSSPPPAFQTRTPLQEPQQPIRPPKRGSLAAPPSPSLPPPVPPQFRFVATNQTTRSPFSKKPKPQSIPERPIFIDRYGHMRAEAPTCLVKSRRRRAWLDRSKYWRNWSEDLWIGKQVLGQGSFGLCGLFEYIGADPAVPKHIVVKQAAMEGRAELAHESRLYQRLGRWGSNHILKLLRSIHVEAGTATSSGFDPAPYNIIKPATSERGAIAKYSKSREVSRIYLEFAEGGDMYKFIKMVYKNYSVQNPFPEEYVWRIWECFARGCMVLEHGTEDPYGKSKGDPIVYFDMKPGNVFFGDNDALHKDTQVLKIPHHIERLRFGWHLYEISFLSTAHTDKAQELLFTQNRSRHIGLPLNIWTAASCIYTLVSRGREVDMSTFDRVSLGGDPPIRTFYKNISYLPYSNALQTLLLRCLAYDPADRPDAKELLATVRQALRVYDGLQPPSEFMPDAPAHLRPKPNQQPQPTIEVISSRQVDVPLPGSGPPSWGKMEEYVKTLDDGEDLGYKPPLEDWPDLKQPFRGNAKTNWVLNNLTPTPPAPMASGDSQSGDDLSTTSDVFMSGLSGGLHSQSAEHPIENPDDQMDDERTFYSMPYDEEEA
ncbi:hypothetical protein B7494_g1799 [Chlorociboria aeruginascens]|nr:hypothetical protein B7494_g1799 [Chlorociboria aeruginascens]